MGCTEKYDSSNRIEKRFVPILFICSDNCLPRRKLVEDKMVAYFLILLPDLLHDNTSKAMAYKDDRSSRSQTHSSRH